HTAQVGGHGGQVRARVRQVVEVGPQGHPAPPRDARSRRRGGHAMTTPGHLIPIEPAAAVHALCDRIAGELPRGAYGALAHSAYGVEAELNAWRQTRTPWDGRRLANALRHVLKREDLAREV